MIDMTGLYCEEPDPDPDQTHREQQMVERRSNRDLPPEPPFIEEQLELNALRAG